ncbi:sugar phosphate isomerase/epimerase family protein [Streptomyces bobili]|uniref:sugar phosphate isomerase/epimerase family protein n=1 Tax=Streptomyces bobili TaxID=67280 RepID=UPI00340BA058
MTRPITLFTGQWADLPFDEVCRLAAGWGYDGLEIACWGDHFEIDRVLADPDYVHRKREVLDRHGLSVWAISNHLVGQAVCDDPIDARHRAILPARLWSDDPETVRRNAAREMADTARAAALLGVDTVVGFTGSSIWGTLAMFPPATPGMIDAGYRDFADRWNPVLDVFEEQGVRFALEVHPSEIAYDYWTTRRTLDAIGHRPSFGLNWDPSHMVWQDLDPANFILEFADRIYHVDCKDTRVRVGDGRRGRLSSHLPWGDLRRGWDFVSTGRGDVPWEDCFRALNAIDYEGPVSIEWEDAGMDRLNGAAEAVGFIRRLAKTRPPAASFDAAFATPAPKEGTDHE